MHHHPYPRLLALLCLACLTGCGTADSGTDDDSGGVGSASPASIGTLTTITGSVRGVSGSFSEMAGWVVVFMEKDTGVSKVAEIGPVGTYFVPGVAIDKPQTVLLLDPNYRLASVLVQVSSTPGQLLQYFSLRDKTLPILVQKGPVVNFSDLKGVTFDTKEYATDANNDGIPDGLIGSGLAARLSSSSPHVSEALTGSSLGGESLAAADAEDMSVGMDTNNLDMALVASDMRKVGMALAANDTKNTGPDIDRDGIANWYDVDMNGNGVPNIFDPDADGNSILDSLEPSRILNYKLGVEYAFVQVIQQTKADGSLTTNLQFMTKIRSDFANSVVSVRTGASLLQGAVANVVNLSTGAITSSGWDRTLADDGANNDGVARDNIFGRNVQLADGKELRANQVLFIDVSRKFGNDVVLFSYPYVIPGISVSGISATYNSSGRVLTRTGGAFGAIKDFRWSVNVFDSAGKKVFSSAPILGTQSTYTLPPSTLDPGQRYTAVIYAQSFDAIPSYPAWVIKSMPVALN